MRFGIAETGLKAAARAAMRTVAEGTLRKAAAAKALAAAVAEGAEKMYGKAAGALGGAARREAAAKLEQAATEAAAKAAEDAKVLAAKLAKDAAEAEIARIEQAICDPHAMQHIFEGEIKVKPNGIRYGVGVHSMDAVSKGTARIKSGTVGRTAANGAFEAEVELIDQAGNVVPKKGAGKSTFFPPSWSKEKIMQEIERAHANKVFKTGSNNTYIGTASDGSSIQMFVDGAGKIISAFPTF